MSENKVIYDDRIPRIKQTPKKPKSNKRFIILLLLFFSIILSVLYFQSPFSKLSEIETSGHQILDKEQLLQEAGIHTGMSYFNFTINTVQEQLENMIEIKEVSIDRKFPNKLSIDIVEYPVVAFWNEDHQFYPILTSGHILLNRPWPQQRIERPILSGWPHKEGLIELSAELGQLSPSVSRRISEIVLTPILSDPYRLTLYMIDGYEVRTSIRKFAENMSWYPEMVEQALGEGSEGGIFYLLDGKWYEDPHLDQEEIEEDS